MQKRENKTIFFADFWRDGEKTKEYAADSKTQREYAGFRAPQAPQLGLQSALQAIQLRQTFRGSRQAHLRVSRQ